MPHLGNAVLRVQVYQSNELVGEETFRERHIVVGRDPTMADLVIGSGKISREHVLLEHDGQRIFVHDLGSTNGIFLNGMRVDRAEIGPADALEVGSHSLRLNLLHSGEARAQALAAKEAHRDEGVPLVSLGEEDEEVPEAEAVEAEPTHEVGEAVEIASPLHHGTADDEWDGADFAMSQVLLDEPAAVTSETPVQGLQVAAVKTRGTQVLGHVLVRPGRRYRPPAPHVKERWGTASSSGSRFCVYVRSNGTTQVELPVGCRWSLRRGVGLLDEAAGVREGWALRRRGSIWVTLGRADVMRVSSGSVTYDIRFVPASRRLPAAAAPARDPATRTSLVISCALHALAFVVIALAWRDSSPLALANATEVTHLAPQAAQLAPMGTPVAPRPNVTLAGPEGPGRLHVPGGSSGYRAFGLLDSPLTYDPQVPAPAEGVMLKRAAAFLRGQNSGFAAFIPAAGAGPQWRLILEPGQQVVVSDAQRLPPGPATAVVEKSSAALEACYEKALPRDAGLSGRVAIAWLVSASGNVRTVFPSTMSIEPPLFACVSQVLSKLHFAKSRGPDLTVNYTLVFRRVGFD